MLTSLGVFAGLTAVPLVGWVILGAAVILGLATAVIYARSTREKEKIEHLISHHKNLNTSLHKAIISKMNTQRKPFNLEFFPVSFT